MVFRKVCRHLRLVPFVLLPISFLHFAQADEPASSGAAAVPGAIAAERAPPAAEPVFLPAKVPAAGRAQSLLTIARAGRYAITVRSESGTTIQLVDRMGGPGEKVGVAGERDGRIDAFLEPGDYLLRTEGLPGSKGEAALAVQAFSELETTELLLPELREVETELGDLEERSYWFQLDKSQVFIFEAAGRHLSQVALWRDGGWLVDAAAKTSEIEPRPGRPLRLHQLETLLPPGLYRLSLSGGPSLAWADDDGTRPVVFRRGLAVAGEAGRGRHTLGAFGFYRVLVPRSATYVRLELPGRTLPVGKRLAIDWIDWTEGNSFPESYGWLELTKESEPPILEGYLDAEERGLRLLTVSGTAGETFVLQHFNNERLRTFQRDGKYFLATLHAGDAADRVDATAVLTRRERGWTSTPQALRAMSTDVVKLEPGVERRRKVSISGPAEIYLYVTQLGEYEFNMPKTALRVLPFAPTWSYSSATPAIGGGNTGNVPFKEATGRWKLDPGYYVLELQPRQTDIVELHIRALDGGPKKPVITAPHGMARLGEQKLEARFDYTIYVGGQPGFEAGLYLRELPVDPVVPLPIEVADKPVDVPVRIRERGVLRARAEDDTTVVLYIDGKAAPSSTWLDPGEYRVGLSRLDGAPKPVMANLSFEPGHRVAEESLPALPLDAITKVPILPLLDDQGERFFDLSQGGLRTFLVHAEKPALYRIESSGLLDTEGSLRTSLRPRLDAAGDGGSGRNFLLQQYLRPGDYQLSVKALGKSAGHLGVRLARSPVRDGGTLLPGVAARSELPAGEAIAYRLKVGTAGKYRVRALGLGKPFRIRLDDADGWPLPTPGTPGDLYLDLNPGEYQLIVLPQAVDGRVITRFDVSPVPEGRKGHGPFVLPFGTEVRHRWVEPAEGEERRPDVFTFNLPAAAGIEIELDAEMRAEIYRVTGKKGEPGEKVADVPPARVFRGSLPAGDYELRASCSRLNNRVDYRLRLSLDELVAGQSRRVKVPSEVEISLGSDALAEISSFGQVDVRARLQDERGVEIARFDDRPGDWNFSYTGRLAAGRYRLTVDPVSAGGETEILLRLPKESLAAPANLPLSRKLKLAAGIEVFPLVLPAGAEVLALSAAAPSNVRLALEAGQQGVFREVASREGSSPRLLAWLAAATEYRLRVESLSHGEVEVTVLGAAMSLSPSSEKALAAGVKSKAVPGLPADFGVVAAAFDKKGCFQLTTGQQDGLLAVSQPGRAAEALLPGQVILGAPMGRLLLVADPRSNVRLQRWRLPDGDATLFLPAEGLAHCDLPASKEGLRLLRASALAGQPSLAPGSEAGFVQAVAAGTAVTLLPSTASDVQLRGEGGAPLRLMSRSFKPAVPAELGTAGGEGEVVAGGSLAWRLPAGAKQLRLLLDKGLVASLEGGGEPRRVFSAEDAALDVALVGGFELLQVVNPETHAGKLTLSLLAGGGPPPPAPGQPWETRLARQGQLELQLAAGSGFKVHVRGARGSLLLGEDGSIARGNDLTLPPGGGRLVLDGEPGLLWVWLDQGQGELTGLWPENLPATGRKVALPALAELGAGVEVFDFDFPAATLIHLRGNQAGVVAAEIAGTPGLQVSAHAEAISADLYLPQGRGRVALRAATGAAGALLELRASPVEAAGEGLGPTFLLGPGQSRYVSFKVPAAGKIGWAARAEAGVVDGRLLRADGSEVGRGGAGFLDLPAGEYLLGLSVPADARPTRVRAALVGLVRPNDLPPQELIALYVSGEQPLPGVLQAMAAEKAEREREAAAAAAAQSGGGDGEASDGEGGEEEGSDGEGSGEEGSDESGEDDGCEGEECEEGGGI